MAKPKERRRGEVVEHIAGGKPYQPGEDEQVIVGTEPREIREQHVTGGGMVLDQHTTLDVLEPATMEPPVREPEPKAVAPTRAAVPTTVARPPAGPPTPLPVAEPIPADTLQAYRERVSSRGVALSTKELGGLVAVSGQSALDEFDRLTGLAGGSERARYLLTPIILYDNPYEAFRIMADMIKSPSDLKFKSQLGPPDAITYFFQTMVRVYQQRFQQRGRVANAAEMREDIDDVFFRVLGGPGPIREPKGPGGGRRAGRAPKEPDPSQEDAIRVLEEERAK